jgi:dihydrolipoamide dehydrogenase
MDNQTRELVIIGAGPGGYAAAFHAADLGLSVTLIDREPNPGGVCLYRGCIPAKVLLHVAKIIREAQKAKDWGVDFGPPRIDTDRLREWKNKVVSRLTRGLGMLSKKRKVEYIQGTARFTGPRTIRVDAADGQTRELMFEQAILATGAHIAALPNLPMESERMMTSDDALEVHGVPQTLLVIGGGYIGMELANVYARLGSRVTVAEMMPRILTELDDDLLAVLRKSFDEYIETILVNTKVTQTEETAEGIRVWFDGDGKDLSGQTFEKVLVAVGRKPNTARIGLEHTGVQLDERGFVRVDDQRRTGDDRIFAIGDLTGNPQFAHKAMHEGRVAAHLIAGRPAAFDPEVIPFVEYTEIEAAGCGLSERQAREEGRNIRIARFPWSASGRALTLGEDKGLTKLIFEEETGRLIGAGIVGADAGKLISEAALAVEMAAVAQDLALTIHPHPTLSETIMEAAEIFLGGSIHL